MATLLVRDVDEVLVRKLHQRAKANGRSAAEEHRTILRDALLGGAGATFDEIAATLRRLSKGRDPKLAEEYIREDRDRE